MKIRKLRDLEVSAIGYGCMGLSHGYGPVPDRPEAVRLICHAFDKGCTFFDTAEGYGGGTNETLMSEALHSVRDKVVYATKFGGIAIRNGKTGAVELRPQQIRQRLEGSLQRLRTDRIDLYYQHRVSKEVPVEEVAGCMGELIKEGKIIGWGLSQATEDEVRRANAVTPLTAIQSEYSIMERMFEKDVLPACEELGIGFVPFSPLAGGFLSGTITKDTVYAGDDVRDAITRYQKDNIAANQPLLDLINQFAALKNATPAQISLAWMLHKKDFIVPIPGSRKNERIEENLGAANVELTEAEYNQIETELAKITIHGNRTDDDIVFGRS